ncbi:MAG: Crp/Fnr family transcriptional regulator [Sphingomicrobium sp.]
MRTSTLNSVNNGAPPGPALAFKLQAFTRLSAEDVAALQRLTRNVRTVEARRDLLREGEVPVHVHLILRGWACRYKSLPDGKRQIVSLMVPGDLCDLNNYVLREMDHSVGAITLLRVSIISREEMEALSADHPRVAQALIWDELVEQATQREWLLNLGQRSAYARIAHLILELFLRLRTVGLTDGRSCDFPLTQNDLADATGLTAVHVNRMLQELRADGLIELERKRLFLPDIEALKAAAMFNPNYLHLDHEGRSLDANA